MNDVNDKIWLTKWLTSIIAAKQQQPNYFLQIRVNYLIMGELKINIQHKSFAKQIGESWPRETIILPPKLKALKINHEESLKILLDTFVWRISNPTLMNNGNISFP